MPLRAAQGGLRGSARPLIILCALAGLARAQAEQAPPEYVPPNRPSGPRATPPPTSPDAPPPPPRKVLPQDEPKWHALVAPRMVVRLGDGPAGLPVIGYGGGVAVGRALVPLGRARFGLGFRFAYDRVFADKPAPLSGTQFLSHATFGVALQIDGIYGRVRPWGSVGGGMSVAVYEEPALPGIKGASLVGVAGLVQLALGLAVRVYESFELGLHGEFNFTFSDTPEFTPGLFALALDIGFRF